MLRAETVCRDLNYTKEELLQVIKDADTCLRQHRGVGLDYYMHDPEICGQCRSSVIRSKNILRYIFGGKNDR